MQIKKQLINVLTATAFTFLSMLLFKVVASSMIAGYGDFAKEAFAMAFLPSFLHGIHRKDRLPVLRFAERT